VGPFYKQYRTLELDVAACTRYRIVAWYTNLTHIEWSPVIYRSPSASARKVRRDKLAR